MTIKTKLTSGQKVHARLLLGRGIPKVDIAKKFGVSYSTITAYFKLVEAKRTDSLQFKEGQSKGDKIRELMENGYSPGEIANIFSSDVGDPHILPSQLFNLNRLNKPTTEEESVSEETAVAWSEINKEN
jgi:uncharacterized protein YoaH (UPF0181 family)